MDYIELDASIGEGGGQVLRTSLALSILTNTNLILENVRAKRSRPGLMRQHLTGVKAAAQLCDAQLTGAEIGSTSLRFEPGETLVKDMTIKIGTAGSTTLVLQTILPVLMCASTPCEIRIHGGTHNPMAPSYDFLREVFLPQLKKIGPEVELECERHGFYPAGGGRLVARIQPVARDKFRRFELLECGRDLGRRGESIIANLPENIAHREIEELVSLMGWQEQDCTVRAVNSSGPGNVVLATMMFENVTEQMTSFGEKGKPGERVVRDLVKEVRRYLASGAPVGEYLADQLLLPMALGAGGEFRCSTVSQHTKTQAEVIEKFLEVEIGFERVDEGGWKVVVDV